MVPVDILHLYVQQYSVGRVTGWVEEWSNGLDMQERLRE